MPTITAPRRPRLPGRPLLDLLAWPHGIDRYLELIDPRWTSREVRARVTSVRSQTPDTVTVTLRPNDAWTGFEAGQFVRLTVEVDGVRRTRCYSPANSAAGRDGLIELTARVHDHGTVSPRLRDLRPGTVVTLSPAEGTFTLPAERPAELVLVSGGSGITPVLSMLRTLADEGHRGSVTLLHYSLDARHVLYRHELAALDRAHPGVCIVHAYTDQDRGADLHGCFEPGHLRAAAPRYAEAEIYVCGPNPLLDGVRDLLRAEGLSDRLHVEQFAPPLAAPVDDPDAVSGDLVFVRSARRAANTGATLLDQAEAAGLTPDSGCRMGICHTCTTRKVSGATRDLRTGEVHTAPDCDIQLCVNVPVGDVELLV